MVLVALCGGSACKKDPYRDVPDISSMPTERSKTTGVVTKTDPNTQETSSPATGSQTGEPRSIPVARRDDSGSGDSTDLLLQKPMEIRSLPGISLTKPKKGETAEKKDQDGMSLGVGGLQMDSSMQSLFDRPSRSLLGDGSLSLNSGDLGTSTDRSKDDKSSSSATSQPTPVTGATTQPADSTDDDSSDTEDESPESRPTTSTTRPTATARPTASTTRPAVVDETPVRASGDPSLPMATSTRLGAGGSSLFPEDKAESVVIPEVLARVNEEAIDRWSFMQLLQEIEKLWTFQQGYPPSAAAMTELRKQALKRSIDHVLLHQKAQQEGTTLSSAEEIEGIRLFLSQFPKRTTVEEYLKSSGMTRDQFMERLRRQLVVRKYMMTLARQIPLDAKQIREYYNKHFNESSVRARQLVVSIAPGKEAEAEAKARQILALAKKPDANFPSLIQKYSDDPGKEQGGDLGIIKRGDALPDMEEVLFSLQKGQVGGPIKTDAGYHLVQVVEQNMPKPLAQVQVQIVEQLQMKKLEKILLKQVEELRSEAQIIIDVPWGKDP